MNKQFLIDALMYVTPYGINNRKLKKFRKEEERLRALNNDQLETLYLENKVKVSRHKQFIPFWVSIIFAAIFSDFSEKFNRWFALMFINQDTLDNIKSLTQQQKYMMELTTRSIYGFVIILLVVCFATYIYRIGTFEKDLLMISAERDTRTKIKIKRYEKR